MPIHVDWDRLAPQAVWHDYRGPLIALAVALALALAGRFTRSGWLAAAAGGGGVVAGWFALGGRIWVTYARPSVDHLALPAAVALLVGLFGERLGRNRGPLIALLLTAAVIGWWLCGAPRSQAELLPVWPVGLGAALAVVLFGRALAGDSAEPMQLALAGLAMALSFHIVALPPIWMQLALVPALAALALLALPAPPGLAALPIAADIAAVAGLAVIDFGRLPHPRVGAVDVAAAAPLLAVWLTPRLAGRLGLAGRAATAGAGLLAAAAAGGVSWIALRTLGR
jgi:hypothetical protein